MANNTVGRSVVVGTAGHIDHGKSSLVLALTGTDPDRLKEEKARGITIDLGFAHARVGDLDVAFVDVPGHERFVKNMLAGVGGIDAVLLVIAADESVMPQTREHFAICRLLEIPAGVVALTKADLVDAETLELARAEATELIAGSRIEGAAIVPVSSTTGEGLDALRSALAEIGGDVPDRAAGGVARLPVDRVFSMRGFGTVVTGTLTSGTLKVDDELVLQPGDRRVKVRGLQVHGVAQRSAEAGRRVAVNLAGVDVADVGRGQTLTSPGALEATRRFDVVIDLLEDARALRHGARVRFHQGTSELLGRVAVATDRTVTRATESTDHTARHKGATESTDHTARHKGDTERTDRMGSRKVATESTDSTDVPTVTALEPGGRGYARIRLEAPAVLTRGDRFILRQYSPSMTIGGGRVLDPSPARSPIRNAEGIARFARLDAGDEEAALVFVKESRAAGIAVDALARRLGLTLAQASSLADRLAANGRVVRVKDDLFDGAHLRELEARLVTMVTEHHAAQPMSDGLPREEARERLFARASPALFDAIVAGLQTAGRIAGRDRLALPGRGVSLSPEEARAQQALDRVYRDAGLAPPDAASAAAAAQVPAPIADRVSKLLLRQKTLVKVDTLLFHADALERLKEEVKALKGQGAAAKVDVAGFKERYGISRKYAIPLLEWLDRERVTRRSGDARVVL